MTQVQYRIDRPMSGNGYHKFEVPAGDFKYVAILNSGTDNFLELQQGIVTEFNPAGAILQVSPYQNVTIPINLNSGRYFTILWRDGGKVMEKKVTLLFCVENPNINFQGSDGGSMNTITINNDNVGLAKQAQLPPNLEGGRLAVSIQSGVGLEISEPLPEGANVIGKIDINNAIPEGNNHIGSVTVTNQASAKKMQYGIDYSWVDETVRKVLNYTGGNLPEYQNIMVRFNYEYDTSGNPVDLIIPPVIGISFTDNSLAWMGGLFFPLSMGETLILNNVATGTELYAKVVEDKNNIDYHLTFLLSKEV